MAHLTLDAVTVAVNSVDEDTKEIGNRQDAFDGSYLISRQATKRAWSGQTPPLPPNDAAMVRGIIQGAGLNWSMERGVMYPTSGLAATAAASYAIPAVVAGDGAAVVNEYGDAPVKYGGYSLSHYNAGVVNQLAADTRDAEGATGAYTAAGGLTLAMDATKYWQGTKSVEATYPGAGTASIRTPDASVGGTIGEKFTGSVYLRGASGGETVDVIVWDEDLGVGTANSANVLTTGWTRLAVTHTLTGATTDLRIYVQISASAGEVVYCDGWQLEEAPMASKWYDGTPPTMELYYSDTRIAPKGSSITVAGWAYMPDQSVVATQRYLFDMSQVVSGSTVNVIRIIRRPDVGVGLSFVTIDEDEVSNSLNYGTDAIWATGWHHFACIVNVNPDTGRLNKEIYFDGALVGSINTALIPNFTGTDTLTTILMANSITGATPMQGSLDQLRVLPYCLSAAAIAALFASSAGAGETPIITADGDAIATTTASVIGQVTGVSQVKTAVGFRKAVSFDLREV